MRRQHAESRPRAESDVVASSHDVVVVHVRQTNSTNELAHREQLGRRNRGQPGLEREAGDDDRGNRCVGPRRVGEERRVDEAESTTRKPSVLPKGSGAPIPKLNTSDGPEGGERSLDNRLDEGWRRAGVAYIAPGASEVPSLPGGQSGR